MVLKKGRFGQFFACSGYPDCKTTKQLGEAQKPKDVPLDEKCPQCGNNLVMKYGRFGEFMACSNYPDLQIRQAEDDWREVPELLRGRGGGARGRSAARRFTGATAIPTAISWPGASR